MKKLLLAMLMSLAFGALSYGQVSVTSANLQSAPAYSCSTNVVVASGDLFAGNYTFVGNTVTVNGSTIEIDIAYSVGPIILPVIMPFTQSVNLTSIPAGTYTVNVNGVLNGTTNSTVSFSLTVLGCCPAQSSFNILDNTLCLGDSVEVNNTSVGQSSQSWYLDNTIVSSNLNFATDTISSGTHSIKLVVTDGTCSDSVTSIFTIDNPPVISSVTPVETDVCEEEMISINSVVSGASGYIWYLDGAVLTSGQNLNYLAFTNPGVHDFDLYANNAGCVSTLGTQVTVLAAPNEGDISPNDTSICLDESLTFSNPTSSGFVQEEWYLAGTQLSTSTSLTHLFDTEGMFTVEYKVSAGNGCFSTASANVTVNELPNFDLGADTNVCNGPIDLDAGAGYATYMWTGNNPGQTLTVDTAGTFTCTVTNGDGCEASDQIYVDDCASLIENSQDLGIKIYPNPATHTLNISTDFSEYYYEIYDMRGMLVLKGNKSTIHLSALETGLYVIKIEIDNSDFQAIKFIKK